MIYQKNRAQSGNKTKISKVRKFILYAEDKILNDKWSLDAVVGYAKHKGIFKKEEMVCTRTLYNYIDNNYLKVRNIDLALKIRRKPKKTKRRTPKMILGKSIKEENLGIGR